MKKILVIAICVLVILIGIIAFDKYSDSKNQQQEEIPSAVTQVSTYIDNGVEKTTVIEIPTKDPNALVNFTMPISHLPDEAREDMKKYCAENNYESCVINEADGTYTVTMKALTHDFMLTRVGLQVIKNIAKAFDVKAYSYVKDIDSYNDNFSEITLLVDGEGYAAAKNRETLLAHVGSCGIFYQLYTPENTYTCRVIIKDEASGEIIDAKSFEQDNYGLKS